MLASIPSGPCVPSVRESRMHRRPSDRYNGTMAAQPLSSESTLRLDQLFRSDHLVTIREVFAMSPELQLLVRHQVVQVFAIVDANVIQGELRWRLGSREKRDARSGLQEALDAAVLVLIAPNFLKVEIEKYLPAIAYETESILPEAEEEWKAVQAKLHFYEPSSRLCDNRVADPKDLPYVNASAELGLPVYTRDKDLKRMGAPVLWVCIDAACRDHARATSVTLGFTAGSTFTLTIGAEALRAAIRGMKGLYEAFRKQPIWLQLAVAGALAAIAIHPRSRAKILELWKGVSISAVNVKGPLLDAFLAVMKEIASAQSSAHRTKREIESVLPPTKKVSALVYARRICIVAESPISSDEIVRRMRSAGYVSRGKRPADYLRRVLRQSGEFIELRGGTWQFRPRSMGSPGSLPDSFVQQNAAI
jgi:hypothetical protein